MREKCGVVGFFQEYPKGGRLKDNLNFELSKLFDKLGDEQGLVYGYVLTTIRNEKGNFFQNGCGPNFQGGIITLCTCKHYMRTWEKVEDWKGVWIAGFTHLMENERNYLFYLMKVSRSFRSHKQIWDALVSSRTAKNARINPLGDIYEPKDDISDEFNYLNYYPPVKNHVHENCWHNDICYEKGCGKRMPSLLVGDPKLSFLWRHPIIHFRSKHPRTKIWKIEDFFRYLVQEPSSVKSLKR